jgi:hypothetical protein
MPTTIQRITIEGEKIVDFVVADAPTPEAAMIWIHVRVPCPVERNRPLAKALLTAPRHARSALDAEMAPLKSLEGRDRGRTSETVHP